jgi:hypothetical protein
LVWITGSFIRALSFIVALNLCPPFRRSPMVTALVLVSGQVDVAGQVLLASGLYALWCLVDARRKCGTSPGPHHEPGRQIPPHPTLSPRRGSLAERGRPWRFWAGSRSHAESASGWFGAVGAGSLRLAAGWAIGLLLAAPALLPVWEYAKTGARMVKRGAGSEERPPIGLAALPLVVLPGMYGTTERPSLPISPVLKTNLLESTAGAYAGLLATLLAAPLAWCSRRHRSTNYLLIGLAVFGLSWSLNLPGFVSLLRLPVLNMMSHNRLVFLTAFAIVCLSATGLEAVAEGAVRWRAWMWAPLALLAAGVVFCLYRAAFLPGTVAERLGPVLNTGKLENYPWIEQPGGVGRAQAWFAHYYLEAAVGCAVGVAGWLILWARRAHPAIRSQQRTADDAVAQTAESAVSPTSKSAGRLAPRTVRRFGNQR